MRAKELRGHGVEDLKRELGQLQKELFNMRFQWQAEESPDTNKAKRLRTDIARIKTILQEMEVAKQAPGTATK